MLSSFSRTLLFVSSYLPLALSFAVLYLRQDVRISIVLAAFGLEVFVILKAFLEHVNSRGPVPLDISSSTRRDSDTLAYFATYLIPFALSPPKDWYEAVSMLIFFLVLGYVYVNSNLIYINPVLNIMGYHLFEVTIGKSTRTHTLLARAADEVPPIVHAVYLANGLYIQTR